MPLISVIIPTYNRTKYLQEAINSVFSQTCRDFEIIVVDDGSKVDVQKVLSPFGDKIKYFYQENKGLAAARNTGIKQSDCKYIVFLDDDDLLEPKKLQVQVSEIDNHSKIGFVYSDFFRFKDENPGNASLNLAAGRDNCSDEFPSIFFVNHNVAVPTLMIRRSCFEDVGMFDESLRQHEDGDMFLRIALRWGVKFSHYPSARVRVHSGNMSKNRSEMYSSIIKSWEKILTENNNFKDSLGDVGASKMKNLNIQFVESLIKEKKITEALDNARFHKNDFSVGVKLSLALRSRIPLLFYNKLFL